MEQFRYKGENKREITTLSPVLKEYCEAQEHQEDIHGKKTIVMMQIGAFLEMTKITLEDGTEIGNTQIFEASLKKMKSSSDFPDEEKDIKYYKGQKIISIDRYGFNLLEETKKSFIGQANEAGYTVPVYYETQNDPIKKTKIRKCLETWSPVIRPGDSIKGTRWFGTIILDDLDFKKSELGFINPVTRSYSSFTVHKEGDISPDAHTLYIKYSVSQLIIWIKGSEKPDEEKLKSFFGIPNECSMRIITLHGLKTDLGEAQRSEIMKYIGNKTISIGEGSIPSCIARGFYYLHNVNPKIIKNIKFVENTLYKRNLILENQPLRQLNIIPSHHNTSHVKHKFSCVQKLLDNTLTEMGKRQHNIWITTPLVDIKDISQRQEVGKWFTDHKENFRIWKEPMKAMPDIETLFSAKIYGGMSYLLVWKCAVAIKNFVKLTDHSDFPLEYPKEKSICFYENILNNLVDPSTTPSEGSSIGGAPEYSLNSSLNIRPDIPFNEKIIPDIYKINNELNEILSRINKFISFLQNEGGITKKRTLPKNSIRLMFISDTYIVYSTKAAMKKLNSSRITSEISWRGAVVQEIYGNKHISFKLSEDVTFKYGIHDDYEKLGVLLNKATSLRKTIDDFVVSKWEEWCTEIKDKYEKTVKQMGHCIGYTDVAMSAALSVETNGYIWPTIKDDRDSWVSVRGLRHPIIEKLSDIKYVSHDISIGNEGKTGNLIYGVNSSGKSSLMKALGINIILAQCGFPVSAKEMKIGLFEKIYTRILGNDDLFRGLSTFKVEANELKTILNGANNRSLVLGDELCSGTEQYGAESIVAASILTLLKRRTPFLFATHWHRLRDIPNLYSHPHLKWSHLSVWVDQDGNMHMDRRLLDGAGPRGYAIDFMERMGADKETMEEARNIHKMITSEDFAVLSSRAWKSSEKDGVFSSTYNSRAQISTLCQVCNENPTEETDHIIPQCSANSKGGLRGIGSVHDEGNLVGLCKHCHLKKTNGEINIRGFKEIITKKGDKKRILDWEEIHIPEDDEDEDEDDDFMNSTILKMACNGKTKRQIQLFLKNSGIKITINEITRIIKEHTM
jgi:DNA mismatch repair ATPase MutS